MSERASQVYRESKRSPFSGRLWRVVEVRTVDTSQVMGYELQTYSRQEGQWFAVDFNQRPEKVVKQWEQNTGEV